MVEKCMMHSLSGTEYNVRGNTAIAARLFFEKGSVFLENPWHFKDIFREFKAFF
jgi:hypothetical protein